MAERGIQLIRTDDVVSGVVKFFDRRETDVQKAYIARVDVNQMIVDGLTDLGMDGVVDASDLAANPRIAFVIRLAVHGATQNILDASNKLSGNDRVAYVRTLAENMQRLTWASAPVDEAAAEKRVQDMLAKLPPEVRARLLADAAKRAE